MSKFGNIEPQLLWKYFEALTNIPRPSKKEAAVCEYIRRMAHERGLAVREDKIGNIVVCVPATKSYENSPSVVLQGHVDMVTEKNSETKFDFDTEPIPAYVDGDWIRTRGTTLGADNGIGVAAALALMDDVNSVHGPLELLFTIDEETGLTGATNLDGSVVKSKIMLNLDSEEEGIFYIGCAGGATGLFKQPAKVESVPAGEVALSVAVRGLRGGHSGLNIIDNRGNALKLLARAIAAASAKSEFRIALFQGGSKHNAIPREAVAEIFVPPQNVAAVQSAVQKVSEVARREFGSAESGLDITCEKLNLKKENAFTISDSRKLVNLVLAFHHGVHSMSRDLPGLVETSSNLGIVNTDADGFAITTSVRSSIAEARDALAEEILSLCLVSGCEGRFTDGYPAWRPNPASPLLARAAALWESNTGHKPTATAIHAGLECGVILEKCPGMDILSFGPDIRNAHSPTECCHIPSTERFYVFLKELLASLAKNPL
jgi:dipeptidase D